MWNTYWPTVQNVLLVCAGFGWLVAAWSARAEIRWKEKARIATELAEAYKATADKSYTLAMQLADKIAPQHRNRAFPLRLQQKRGEVCRQNPDAERVLSAMTRLGVVSTESEIAEEIRRWEVERKVAPSASGFLTHVDVYHLLQDMFVLSVPLVVQKGEKWQLVE